MPESNYVFTEGDALIYGTHGDTDYLYHSGDPVPNTGEGTYIFESGVSVGGIISEVTISDSNGSTTGQVVTFSRNETVESFYDFTSNNDFSAARGEINNFLEVGQTTLFVFENQDTSELSFGFVHDKSGTDNQERGGDIHMSISGLPSGSFYAVRDDDPGNDTYSMNPPNASVEHVWGGNNTDGLAIGKATQSELAGTTVTFDVTLHSSNATGEGPPSTIKFVGDSGTSVSRSYDGTNTTVEIKFGNVDE